VALTQLTFTEHMTHILQGMVMQRRTGLLSIERVAEDGREHGEVYFEAGEVTIARTGHQVGVAALATIQQWAQVYYTFYEDATITLPRITEERSLHSSNPHTSPGLPGISGVGTGQHRRLSGALPPSVHHRESQGVPRSTRPLPLVPATPRPQAIPSAIPQPIPVPSPVAAPAVPHDPAYPGVDAIFRSLPKAATPATMYRLERRERIIFALLDGRRTLRDIARLTHQTEVAVARVLAKLLARGYIEHLQG
jgi:hypothetical protein